MIYKHCPYSFVSKLLWSQKVLLSLTRSIYNYSTALKAHLHPGANRVHRSCTRVQMKKRTLVRRVQLHPGANAGKAFISTALEPVWKFISFSHDRSRSGEHIVHIDGVTGSSPVSTTKKPRQSVEVFFIGSEEVGEGAAFASMEVFARPPPVAEAGRGKTVRVQ